MTVCNRCRLIGQSGKYLALPDNPLRQRFFCNKCNQKDINVLFAKRLKIIEEKRPTEAPACKDRAS